MESKIKQIQEEFKRLILNGKYKVISTSEHTTKIEINGLYPFHIWTHEGKVFNIYRQGQNFINLKPFSFEEQRKGLKNFKKFNTKIKDEIIKQKEKLINDTKEEIQELKAQK